MPNRIWPAPALLFLALATLFNASCSRTERVQVDASTVPDVSTVAVAKATLEDLTRDLVLTAEFRPYQEVDLMAKVSGYMKNIAVDVGDRVGEGQVLAVLEIPEMADDKARAQAAISRSKAEVARANNQLRQAQ